MFLDGTVLGEWTDGVAPPAPTGTHWRIRHGGLHEENTGDINEPDINTYDVNKFSIIFWIFCLFFL